MDHCNPLRDYRRSYQDADRRVRELEALNATLAAQIDRMTPVVDAVTEWFKTLAPDVVDPSSESDAFAVLYNANDNYEQQIAALAKGTSRQ